MRRSVVSAVLLAALVGGLLAAAPANAQRSADLVRIPFPQDDGTLTPYTFELGYPILTLVYDTLYWRDRRGNPEPWLARSLRRSDDGRQLTISLRRGVRWHDDQPLTADDVAFSFDYYKRNRHLRFTPQLADVREVRALDDTTVQVDLRRPVLSFLDQPLSDVPIIPRHLWSDLPSGQVAPEGLPVGSGPYRMASYGPGRGYILRANRDYFRGSPRVDRIEVEVMRTSDRTFDALERGNVDMVPAGLTREITQRLDKGLGIEIRKGVNYSGAALSFNLRSPPFDDPAVREAVAQALDLSRIAQNVGQVLPANSGYLHPASPWAPEPTVREADEDAARRALRAAGNPEIEILAPENNLIRLEAGKEVVTALRRVGADATLSEVSRGTLERALGGERNRPTFQAAITGIPALMSYDPNYLRTAFGSRERLNQTGYSSSRFDRLANRVAGARSRGERRSAVAAELRALGRDLPALPLLFSQGTFAYRPKVYNGWVFVKGTGIFDKRSFLTGQGGQAAQLPEVDVAVESDDDDGFPLGIFGIVAAALVFIVIAMGAAAFARRRHRVH